MAATVAAMEAVAAVTMRAAAPVAAGGLAAVVRGRAESDAQGAVGARFACAAGLESAAVGKPGGWRRASPRLFVATVHHGALEHHVHGTGAAMFGDA